MPIVCYPTGTLKLSDLSSYKKKDHAEHNEKACNFLHTQGDYPDWVVTTAFYAALHFVQNEIFPTDIGEKRYISFDNYYNGHFNSTQNKPSKHVATINLVYSELSEEASYLYKWLFDTSMTARYRNFNIDSKIADLSKKRLFELKGFLNK